MFGTNVWSALANGIRDGWSGCDWWLASANGIHDGWPGCVWWFALANGIRGGCLNWLYIKKISFG
jgi:hypothetical protein